MKGKQLAVVLLLLLALGGVALFLRNQSSTSWAQTATRSNEKILSFPLNDVSHITAKTNTNELNLIKKESGWRVAERADYPAEFDKISSLLKNLWELRATQDIKAGGSQLERLQLTEPSSGPNSGTLIDLKGSGDKRLAALLFGKKYVPQANDDRGRAGMATGRYVMVPDKTEHVFLISEIFDEVQLKPEDWLDRSFIQINNVKSIALAGATPDMQWKIFRETAPAPWKLHDGKPGEDLDTATAISMTNYLPSLGFTDVLAPNVPSAETGLDKPSIVIVETFDAFIYELRIGKLSGESYPILVSVKANLPNERTPTPDEKPEDKAALDQQFQAKQKQLNDKLAKEQAYTSRVYLLPKATLDQFLKDRIAILKPQPSPAPKTSATTAPAKSQSQPAPSRSPRPK